MTNQATFHIASLLDKMCSSDKDFRYMATNDLMSELQKDAIKLDDDKERLVVQSLLRLLEDKNGEVQNLAVKCLGPLVTKVKVYQVEWIVDTLCTNMASNKEQLRDISSIGVALKAMCILNILQKLHAWEKCGSQVKMRNAHRLKTVISELPPPSSSLSSNICKRITGRLTDTITKTEDQAVQLEALDTLADLLNRFGALLVSFHSSVLKCVLPLLSSQRLAIRKKAIIALSHLVISANISLFVELITHLINELKTKKSQLDIRTYVQCIGSICRQSGQRVGDYLDKIIPIIINYSNVEGDDELRETCIQTLESFVCKCPKEVTQYVSQIISLCLQYLCYDPNYNYGDDEDEDDQMDTNDMDDEEDLDDDDDEYTDDDDMSWKVRRASAKCLSAILGSRHELLSDFYINVAPKLIARFKEREENVKADIFQAYVSLLRQTKPVAATDTLQDSKDSPLSMLHQQIPLVVKALYKQLMEKNIRTRQGCFHLLTELVSVLPVGLTDYIDKIIPGICFCITDNKNSTSNMKIDTLSFLGCILEHIKPETFYPHINQFFPAVIKCIYDPFYKITSEALTVSHNTIKVMRPNVMEPGFDFKPYLKNLYEAILHRLRAADIDQEVKEKSITCMGQLLKTMGDHLTAELPQCLPIFLDRLKNEITRLTTVKALTMIAGSDLRIDLSVLLNEAFPLMATFLRKSHRGLKLSTLACLDLLVPNYGNIVSASHFQAILTEVPGLISDSDLHISQLTLDLLTTMSANQRSLLQAGNSLIRKLRLTSDFMTSQTGQKIMAIVILLKISRSKGNYNELQQCVPFSIMVLTSFYQIFIILMRSTVFSKVLLLTKSPLLQGHALNSMVVFLTTVVKYGETGLTYSDLIQMLTEVIYGKDKANIPKSAYHSIARCVSALTLACPNEAENVVNKFISDIKQPKVNDSVRLFSLLAVGEIGTHIDLSSKSDLKNVIVNSFAADPEDIKNAASFSLGHVAIGNMNAYLPFILKEIESNAKRQYLLLHSLKEIIAYQSTDVSKVKILEPYVPSIWNLLLSHCENREEGTRNVVAECLGKLTMADPEKLLPQLQNYLSANSAQMRSTILTAFKFTITDQPQTVDALLKDRLQAFLQPITDSDLNVRRVALTTFNSAAHNKPGLIRDLLVDILPHLYNETKVKKELIHEVEMGPFKHTVDDGLDIRKAAFECMYTLLDACLDRLDIFEFLNHVENGLKDHYDIKMLTYLMLVRLSILSPNAVFQHLERIVDPLRSTIQAKVKANSVKQEYEKQDELKRSALRAVYALLQIPDAESHPILSDFVSQIRSNTDTNAMFESVQRDPSSATVEKMDTSS